MPNRRGRTGPALNLATEMFQTVNLNRSRLRNGGADGVCPDIRLFPASALLQVDHLTEVDGARISRCLENEPR